MPFILVTSFELPGFHEINSIALLTNTYRVPTDQDSNPQRTFTGLALRGQLAAERLAGIYFGDRCVIGVFVI